MKRWLWMILLVTPSPLFAQNKKFVGFVLNAAAFRKIQFYCVDTHNLPDDQVKVIDHFVVQESKPRGLLTKLPWHRATTCQEAGIDALVRLEFPHESPFARPPRNEVQGVLLVFRPGSPSPIYETPAVTIPGQPRHGEDDPFDVKLVADLLEYSAAGSVVRILIHDWYRQ